PLGWEIDENGDPLIWFDGRVVTATGAASADGAFWALSILKDPDDPREPDLPPNTLVARPGDFIRAYSFSDPDTWQIARVVKPAVTDGTGSVTLRLDRQITISGARINLAG